MKTKQKIKSLSSSQNQESDSQKKTKETNIKNIKNLSSSKNNSENTKNSTLDYEKTIKKIFQKINHTHISKMSSLKKYIYLKFNNYYSNEEDFYNIKVINEIICNESTHIVAEFKDYLINGDTSEFLQKYYSLKESKECLPKIFEYYDSCSVIFPNYVILPESKYIYKNIQRKQRVIDNQQDLEDKLENIKKGLIKIKDDDNPVFNTVELDSILDQTDTSGIRNFFGIQKNNDSNLESKNISVENIIKKISSAENFNNEIKNQNERAKNINFITINSSKIKGRNYNRNMDSGFINKKNNNNNIGINSISSISKNTKVSSTTIDLENKNQNNNVFYNSSQTIYVNNNNNSNIKKQNLINNLLINKNKEIIVKAFDELNKNKSNTYSKRENSKKIKAI